MYFQSIAALLAMEGHGPYVWTCYLLVFAVFGGLCAWIVGSHCRASKRHDALMQMSGSKSSVTQQ